MHPKGMSVASKENGKELDSTQFDSMEHSFQGVCSALFPTWNIMCIWSLSTNWTPKDGKVKIVDKKKGIVDSKSQIINIFPEI